ncbi:spinster family MFS transporter [Marinobacter sp. X15-166B]|uniref:spinster family MFS transporter n=1 Tax=Marinobacter sp. X15-166B TaxID=1897620 RepID=UPI00085BCF03|nr:MFS transporter [Marinobacter sp. X15-166B]OEY66291.1 transporter [Marinobacter sp. X15-166B]
MSVTAGARRLGWRTHGFLTLLVITYAGSFMGRQIMSVMIEPIKLEFNASDTAMGLISGLAFAVVYAFLGLPAGRLSDRYSRAKVLAFSLGLWAFATLLCGFAVGFWMLIVARMLVAAAEAPVTPASLSLIADLYPPHRRSLAISCFTGAPTISSIVGLSAGAWIVGAFGWRTGFFAIGTPLILMSLIFGLVVREPARGRWDIGGGEAPPKEGLVQAALKLIRNRSCLMLIGASAITTFGAFSFAMWNTAFLVRSHGLSLQHAGILAGVVTGVAAGVGSLFSGWLTDRLSARNRAWLVRMPLIGHAVATSAMVAYLLTPAGIAFELAGVPVPGAMLWCALSGFFTVFWVGPSFNLLTQLVTQWQRATAIALQTVFTTLLGVGLGPLVTGALSDALTPYAGDESLRYALVLVSLTVLIPIGLLWTLLRHQPWHQPAARVQPATV